MRGALEAAIEEARREAEALETWGATEAAAVARRTLDRVEEALRDAMNEPLSLEEASRESGYTKDRLSRLLREGSIPDAGRKHAPRIRRRDVPHKPGHDAWGWTGPACLLSLFLEGRAA